MKCVLICISHSIVHVVDLITVLLNCVLKMQLISYKTNLCAIQYGQVIRMIHCLDEDQKEEVPVDESLINTFKEW